MGISLERLVTGGRMKMGSRGMRRSIWMDIDLKSTATSSLPLSALPMALHCREFDMSDPPLERFITPDTDEGIADV